MKPSVIIAYVAVTNGTRTAEFLSRFRLTFDAHPPGYPCEVVVCANGGPLSEEDGLWLRQEWKCYPRKNDPGFDLSAYHQVAREFECDALLCAGESVYFNRSGWLKRALEVWNTHGPGFYGFFASNLVRPHLNSTCFLCDPKLLKSVPVPRSREERYSFEYGATAFWRRVHALGKPVRLITWSGDYGPSEWRATTNAFWQRDQSDCLMRCVHTDRYDEAQEATKRRWELNADVGVRQ